MKIKGYSFLLIGLVLLLLTSVVGCGASYSQQDLDEAWQAGHDEGYKDGENQFNQEAYFEGFNDARHENKYEVGRAYDRGYERASEVIYQMAYDKGYNYGKNLGYEQGYQNGFWAGEEEASLSYPMIADDNYYHGYSNGFQDGFYSAYTQLGYVDPYQQLADYLAEMERQGLLDEYGERFK